MWGNCCTALFWGVFRHMHQTTSSTTLHCLRRCDEAEEPARGRLAGLTNLVTKAGCAIQLILHSLEEEEMRRRRTKLSSMLAPLLWDAASTQHLQLPLKPPPAAAQSGLAALLCRWLSHYTVFSLQLTPDQTKNAHSCTVYVKCSGL